MPAGACHTMMQSSKTRKPNKRDLKNFYEGSDSDIPRKRDSKELATDSEGFVTSTPRQKSVGQSNPSDFSDDTGSKSESSNNAPVIPPSQPGQMVIKPHCTCAKCAFWNDTKEWINNNECHQTKLNNKPTVCDYKHSLFKKETENEFHSILSLDYSSSTKLEKKSKPKLLLHR